MGSLTSRPVRTLVSILAVALEVTLILVIVGLMNGITNDIGSRTLGVGADIMVQGSNGSILLAFSGSPLPMSYGPLIDKIEGVKAETPVLVQTSSEGGIESVWGIDPTSYQAVGGPLVWIKGGLFTGPNDIVVDDVYAGNMFGVGSEVTVLNQQIPNSRYCRSMAEVRESTLRCPPFRKWPAPSSGFRSSSSRSTTQRISIPS